MHKPVCADDGVHRTNVSAMRAADAQCFVNKRNGFPHISLRGRHEWHHVATQQAGQTLDRVFAARRAQVYRGRIVHDRRGIRPASRVSTLRTLRLWQKAIDLRDQVVLIRRQLS